MEHVCEIPLTPSSPKLCSSLQTTHMCTVWQVNSLYLPVYVLIKNILNVYQKYLNLLLFLTQQYDLEVFRNSYIEIDFFFFNYCMGFHSINMTSLLGPFLLIFSHFHY